ncbi:MAG: Smr/MutS family protein [Mariprofundus sp.]|nr:Smr/MutS family protein [Mariprofundus sp.]
MKEQDLFAEAMGKVQPLPSVDKVVAVKSKPRQPVENIAVRRERVSPVSKPPIALSVQATSDPWMFVADGLSRDRLKRLAAGRPPIGQTFDLHGMTRDEALDLLASGFGHVLSERIRVVCIIHGRGLHSQEGRPVLKEAVYHWLRQGVFAHAVLAVILQPGSGGGACLVLLRRQ